MIKPKVGDYIITPGGKRTVLEVLTNTCLLSFAQSTCRADIWRTFEVIEKNNWTIERTEERWIPELEEDYYYCALDEETLYNFAIWTHDSFDEVMLGRNLVFKTKEEAIKCNELWDINNGRTLCHPCHRTTDTYGFKSARQQTIL